MPEVSFTFDPISLPNLPWSVWPETTGKKGVIRDACNDVFATVRCNSRRDLLEFAKFIEEATIALRGGK